MTDDFQQCMAQATRLTRAGDLNAATALLQQALRQHVSATPRADMGEVIDIECREIGAGEAGRTAPQPAVEPLRARTAAPPTSVSGTFTGQSGTGRAARSFKLFVPPQAEQGQPLPLIVMLHGCTQNPDDFAVGTGMNDLACEQGFCVLYPEQSRQANPQACWNWFKPSHQQRGRGEVATLATMVRETVQRHRIDPARVYVAGLSAGGAMAAVLAQAYPDLIAAVGVHSGLPAGVARDLPSGLAAMKGQLPQRPAAMHTPTIVFHGDADPTVHQRNADALFDAVLPGSGTERREQLQAAGSRRVTRKQRVTSDGRVVAEQWVLHGAGHAWSGGRATGSHTDPSGPSASAEMVRFFATHRLAVEMAS